MSTKRYVLQSTVRKIRYGWSSEVAEALSAVLGNRRGDNFGIVRDLLDGFWISMGTTWISFPWTVINYFIGL